MLDKHGISKFHTIVVAVIVLIVAVAMAIYFTYPSPPITPTTPTSPTTSPTVTTTPTGERVLLVAYSGDIHTLDPLMAMDTDSDEVIANLYDTLVEYPVEELPDGRLIANYSRFVPGLAERFEVSPDYREFTFYLRTGVKFHSGNELNATAVKYTFDRLKEYGWAGIYGGIEKVEIIDKYVVRITLKQSDPLFLHYIALYSSAILNPDVVDKHGGPDPSVNTWLASNEAGSGPFILEELKPGERIVLRAFKEYWKGTPKIDKVIIQIIPDVSVIEMKLIRGELQGPIESPYHIPFKDVEYMLAQKGVKAVQFVNPAEVYYIGLNTQTPPLNDVKVRQAIAHAVPYEDIIRVVAHGIAIRARSMLGPGMMGYDPTLWPYEYNLTRAKELLAEAGYPEGFRLVAYTATGEENWAMTLQILQESFRKVGIELEIRTVSAPTFWDLLWGGKVPLFMMSWPSFVVDPIYHLKFLTSSEAMGPGGNWAFYNNSRVDELLVKAYFETDVSKRVQLIQELQGIIAEEVPYIPIWHTKFTYFMSEGVSGFVYFPDTLTRYYYIDVAP